MALIVPIHGQMSGSIAGNVYAHNKGGQYVRQRVVPTNPNTPAQSTKRAVFAALTSVWANGLAPTTRDGWNTFAANVPVTNRVGQPIFLSGMNWFITVNTLQNAIGGSFISLAPTVFSLAQASGISAAVDSATQILTLSFSTGDPWVAEDGAFLIVQQGLPAGNGVNFFKGPFRIAGGVAGDLAAPPTSPQTGISLQFPVASTNQAFFRVRVIRADGRPSAPQIIQAVVT